MADTPRSNDGDNDKNHNKKFGLLSAGTVGALNLAAGLYVYFSNCSISHYIYLNYTSGVCFILPLIFAFVYLHPKQKFAHIGFCVLGLLCTSLAIYFQTSQSVYFDIKKSYDWNSAEPVRKVYILFKKEGSADSDNQKLDKTDFAKKLAERFLDATKNKDTKLFFELDISDFKMCNEDANYAMKYIVNNLNVTSTIQKGFLLVKTKYNKVDFMDTSKNTEKEFVDDLKSNSGKDINLKSGGSGGLL